jgi:CRP/FNR family transcriptional regulator
MQKKEAATVISIANIKAACRECTLRELCLPLGLHGPDMLELERLVRRRRPLKKGEYLYRHGDPLKSLFAVRRGTIKTTGLMEDGRVQVTGFYLAGELLGIDAISHDRHPCSAEAVEPTEICEIPYLELETVAQHVPGLQHQLFKIMSREILRDEQMLMMLGRMTAEERLAAALLSLERRQQRLGGVDGEIRLPMSRQDLGDYLGLALETVSRLFSRFQEEGLIEVHGRQIRITDPKRLLSLGGTGASQQSQFA